MNLQNLQKPIDLEHISFMPNQVFGNSNAVWMNILAYKDARVDMKVLDSVCGIENWQTEYKRDSKGILQCGIGIYIESRKEWVWKWSNGTESQFEKQKGEYSDAFKRAGFMWGIGRELYDMPRIVLTLDESEYKIDGNNNYKWIGGSLNIESKWKWWLSDDRKAIRLEKKYSNGEWKKRIDTEPYKKEYNG